MGVYLTSMDGGGVVARCGESIFTRAKVFARASVKAAFFHPKHSKLRPRSRKKTQYI